jgi:cytochrome c biogenesis protein CcdA
MNELTLPLIIFGALGDSINPCAIAVLIFLATFLISIRKRGWKFLAIGLIYILFVYITYFLAGIGLLTVIKKLELTKVVYIIAAYIVIIAGVIDVVNVLLGGKGITLAIPKAAKPIIFKYIKAASIPAAIVLGILVSLFELPCTGGIYIAIIGLLAGQATVTQGILYLLLYNLIFVFPLVAILFIAYFSLSSEALNAWRKKNKLFLRFVMGISMIVLGALMLWGSVL